MEQPNPISRRALLLAGGTALGGAVLAGLPGAAGAIPAAARPGTGPALSRSKERPVITHGVQSGDVTGSTAVIWSRADRASRLHVEYSTTESFRRSTEVRGPLASAGTDFTAKVRLSGLPSGQRVFYRVTFVDRDGRAGSEPVIGSLTTPGRRHGDDVRFTWTGDCAGQGWGINPDLGGMVGWETMRSFAPDFSIFSGDTVYADGPLVEQVTLADGSTWRNLVTPEKAKVAETLEEYRGQFRYNLLDDNFRRFNAEVPMIAQWDDHEVVNNWYPGEILEDDRYTIRDVDTLTANSARAFHEYLPVGRSAERVGRVYRKVSYGPAIDVFVIDMRTFRGPNTANLQAEAGADTAILGAEQVRWLLDQLQRSNATWKVIASDMPIGLNIGDGANWEAVANGENGVARGRELELAHLLGEMKRRGVADVVWLTADVHYAAAHHYHPDRAASADFDPFWEFVAGPIHAGTFGPNSLDATFGPEVVFAEAALYPNMPPSEGRQYFGVCDYDGASGALTVRLVNVAGQVLFEQRLEPSGRR